MSPTAYFENQLALLNLEKEEDLKQFENLQQSASIADKRLQGLCWYPVAIRGQEMGRGDYLSVELEKTTHQDLPHQFRFGMPVRFFSNHDSKNDYLDAIIQHQGGQRMKISLRQDELPEWASQGKLGVELLFDNNSYEEMQRALKNEENHIWLKYLLGKEEVNFESSPVNTPNTLNIFQQKAVEKIVNAQKLAIVHGPPGTGKTTTLVAAIQILAQLGQKILITAPSNTAVDLLAEKLNNIGVPVLRIGNFSRISANNTALSLEDRIQQHPDYKEIKKLKKQAAEYKNMAHKYKRNFGKAERDQRKALFDEAHKIMKQVATLEDYLLENTLSKTPVVAATLVGSNHHSIKHLKFDTLVIDEAGQALEPACWIPISKAPKLILAGDHCQLPPTIKSETAAAQGLAHTLFEKLIKTQNKAVVLLQEQYRMHQSIMAFPSAMFYDNQLIAHSSVANTKLPYLDFAMQYIDTAGKSFDETIEGTSSFNPDEAHFLIERLIEITQKDDQKNNSYAIISPYKKQVSFIKETIQNNETLKDYLKNITVNTVDGFQGQEKDVVLLSLVRSNAKGEIGFLADTRRMNVAMTRAKKSLLIIGDSSTIATHRFYEKLIDHCQKNNHYISAWEF